MGACQSQLSSNYQRCLFRCCTVPSHRPVAPSAASSPSCGTPRAAATRQGSPGSQRRTGTSSAALYRGTCRRCGVLLPAVAHIRRHPAAADAREAQRRVRRRVDLVGSVLGGGGGLGSLALSGGLGLALRLSGGLSLSLGLTLRLQRRQRLADFLGAHLQVWLVLLQLGEQRLDAEVGISHTQSSHGLEHRASDMRPHVKELTLALLEQTTNVTA